MNNSFYICRFCGPRVHDPQVKKQLQWGINCVDQYKKLNIAGEGTFGQVYKARHLKTGIICALKKVCVYLTNHSCKFNSCVRYKYIVLIIFIISVIS